MLPYFTNHGFMVTPIYDIQKEHIIDANNRLKIAVSSTAKELGFIPKVY